jgi:hypothetical protein
MEFAPPGLELIRAANTDRGEQQMLKALLLALALMAGFTPQQCNDAETEADEKRCRS